jgi:spermidine/putrescine transport system ATP-binding protein
MIELIGVRKQFGSVAAVDGVSLHVHRGEFMTLLGPSGCGKTTLLRMIAGFVTPDEGKVLLEGVDVTGLPPYRRDVNQVFQSYALFPHMNVRENVAFGLRMKKLARREIETRVSEGLALVSLSGLEDRRPAQLSGGQQQRVALARAIVCRPKVLLLDEPLAALDAKLRQGMQVELKELQRRLGITFVFVTHDQAEALVMSDRVAVMNAGKVEQVGTPREIYSEPATPFVGAFVGQANMWKGEIVKRDGEYVWVRVAGDVVVRVKASAVSAHRDSVRVLLRPERVRICERAEGAEAFEAEVCGEHFGGATSQLRLKTKAGLDVHALISHTDGTSSTQVGQRLWCTVAPEDLIVLRD